MTLSFALTLKQIEESDAFKNFKEKNEEAYLCAGFFIIDYQAGKDQQQLDYSLKNGKIFTFLLDKEVQFKEAETIKTEKLPKISSSIKVDLAEVEEIVGKKLKDDKTKINKIIAVLQKDKDKEIWNLSCMMEGFGILQVHIDAESGEVLKFEKRNMFDFVKQIK